MVALIVSSIPAFWLGLLLMLLFSVKLGILPSNGFDTPLHWILPLLCSCFGTWAGSSRYIRAEQLRAAALCRKRVIDRARIRPLAAARVEHAGVRPGKLRAGPGYGSNQMIIIAA